MSIIKTLFFTLAFILAWSSPVLHAEQVTRLSVEDFKETWRWRSFENDGKLPSGPVAVLGGDNDDVVYLGTDEGLYGFGGFKWSVIKELNLLDGESLNEIIISSGEVFVTTSSQVMSLQVIKNCFRS